MTIKGHFQQTPFPALCLEIWRARLTGSLQIHPETNLLEIPFQEGDFVVTASWINREKFLEFIRSQIEPTEEKILPGFNQNELSSPSFIKILIENSPFSAQTIWTNIREFFYLNIQPLFDLTEGNYQFIPGSPTPRGNVLIRLSTPEVVNQGISKIKNIGQFKKYYPDKKVLVKIQKNPQPLPWLSEPAKYLLNLLKTPMTLEQLINLSQLGEEETYRLLFLFSCFKIVNLSLSKTINRLQPASPQKLAQTIDLFIEKSSFILKYLSKEIGPVATSIIQKSISECKSFLPTIFSDVEIDESGQIIFGRVFKSGIAYASPELQAQVIDGLNELFLTQLLAVKRTLGDDHEIRLVEALQSLTR